MGAKSNLYRDVKDYLRTAQAAIKNKEMGIANEALGVVNEVYTKASKRFPNLGRKDLPNYSLKNGIVTVELQGSCSGCPSSIMTLKQGVQNLLCHYVPEVKSVEAI